MAQITETYKPIDRAAWRAWLEQQHATANEIWLLLDDRPEEPTVAYLDAVEEALCLGWIDSIQKRFSENERAQRFSPRKPRSNWTEQLCQEDFGQPDVRQLERWRSTRMTG